LQDLEAQHAANATAIEREHASLARMDGCRHSVIKLVSATPLTHEIYYFATTRRTPAPADLL